MVEMSDVVGEIPVCDGAVTVNDEESVLSRLHDTGVALRRETRVRCGLMFCDIMAFIVTTVLPDMDHVTALSSGTCAVCCVVDFV